MPTPALTDRRRRLGNALLFGLLCGALGLLAQFSPWGQPLEEDLGLSWLFRLRGPIAPPRDLVVVSIDRRSSQQLGLPYDTTEWPRSHHAELIDGLSRAGARAVVFDLWFRRDKPAEDTRLAGAMRRAGNVLVLEHLSKCGEIELRGGGRGAALDPCRDVLDETSTGPGNIAVHQLLPPNPTLAAAAAGSGPFTLPDLPRQVSQFWTFDQNAGGMPSLPTLALLYAALPELRAITDEAWAERIRRALARDSLSETAIELADLQARAPSQGGAIPVPRSGDSYLAALRAALAPPNSRYLNFYGPPLTLPTLSYADALRRLRAGDAGLLEDLRDKLVFVGLSSPVQWQQMDEFTTVFSDPDSGHDISGIEILASAYANLRQDISLKPLPAAPWLTGVFVWGLLAALLARLTPPLLGVPLVLVAGAALLGLALLLFARYQLWPPLVVPLLIQLPAAILGATGLHYREARRDRSRIHRLFRNYLPDEVVDRLVRDGRNPLEDHQTVFGVSLHADAENYTALSEGMDPGQLARTLNAYYEALFAPVKRHQGNISDIVGDAMLAIWASRGDDREIRAQACRAALGMLEAMEEFGRRPGRPGLRSRIGIHCGGMTLAHVGAHDHFEYRAVGDIVNTSARLQELNKQLGTGVLVSAEMVEGLDEFELRPLGRHALRGKESEIEVYELLGLAGGTSRIQGS